jgi:AcrR family transcriptional regulator
MTGKAASLEVLTADERDERAGNDRRILDVAISEFAEKGLAGARVAEIAERAGVNKQLIYYYFASKAGLFGAAQGDMVAISRKVIVDFEADSFRERMLSAVGLTAIERRRTLRRLWMWEALERGDAEIIREGERRAAWELAIDMVRGAQADGEVARSFRPEMVMLALDVIIEAPQMLPQVTKLVTGLEPDSKAFRQRFRAFLGQVLTALQTAAAGDRRGARRAPLAVALPAAADAATELDSPSWILEVAADEFAANGLAGARVNDIASRAGLNKQLLYYYYGSKEGLYGAVLGNTVDDSKRLIDAIAATGDLTKAWLAALAPNTIEERKRTWRLWLWEALTGGAEIPREQERSAEWQRLVAMARQEMDRNELRADLDPALAVLSLDALLHVPYVMPQITKLVTGLYADDPLFAERHRQFVRQFLAALRPTADPR